MNSTNACCEKVSVREKTAREILQEQLNNNLRYAARILERMEKLDSQFGRSILDQPEQKFQEQFSLYGY